MPLGEPCLGYAIPINPNQETEPPDWFLAAYVSAVYNACEAAHVCEVRGFVTQDSVRWESARDTRACDARTRHAHAAYARVSVRVLLCGTCHEHLGWAHRMGT